MTRPALSSMIRCLPLAAALALAAGPAAAQGTAEQREACAPDAVNLCQDTIPDVEKTTACMKAHFAQLSPRCKVAFNAATGGGAPAAPPPAVAQGPALVPGDGAPRYSYRTQDDGLDISREVTAKLCNEGLVDPGTCRRSARILNMQ